MGGLYRIFMEPPQTVAGLWRFSRDRYIDLQLSGSGIELLACSQLCCDTCNTSWINRYSWDWVHDRIYLLTRGYLRAYLLRFRQTGPADEINTVRRYIPNPPVYCSGPSIDMCEMRNLLQCPHTTLQHKTRVSPSFLTLSASTGASSGVEFI